MGRVHRRKGYLIPEAGRTARGTAIVNVLPLESGERITAMLLTREMETEEYLVMVTRNGTVKRIKLGLFETRPERPASGLCHWTRTTSLLPF